MSNVRKAATVPEQTMNSRDQAKRLILQLVHRAGQKGILGNVRLFKAFYFAHLFYFEATGLPLTKWDVVHMPQGPGIEDGHNLIDELLQEGALTAKDEVVGAYSTCRYRLASDVDRSRLEDKPDRESAIAKAVRLIQTKSAAALSEMTHEFSRSWQETKDGETLDVFLDAMSETEIVEWRRKHRQASDRLKAVWNG